jgi:hypothetical protein
MGLNRFCDIFVYMRALGVRSSSCCKCGTGRAPHTSRRWTAIAVGPLRHRSASAALADRGRERARAFLSHAPTRSFFCIMRLLFDKARFPVHPLHLSGALVPVCESGWFIIILIPTRACLFIFIVVSDQALY